MEFNVGKIRIIHFVLKKMNPLIFQKVSHVETLGDLGLHKEVDNYKKMMI